MATKPNSSPAQDQFDDLTDGIPPDEFKAIFSALKKYVPMLREQARKEVGLA